MQLEALKFTLTQMHRSQLDLQKAELQDEHRQALNDLRDSLSKEHKVLYYCLTIDFSNRGEPT